MYKEEHKKFREQFSRFLEKEVAPNFSEWENDKRIPKAFWLKASENGFLGYNCPTAYGGRGHNDFRFTQIIIEEISRRGFFGVPFVFLNELILPLIMTFGSEEQKLKYGRGVILGEMIGALAVTEPTGGSDISNIKTSAHFTNGKFQINGEKKFITCGGVCDFAIVLTQLEGTAQKSSGPTFFIVNSDQSGFKVVEILKTLGMGAQSVGHLKFKEVEIAANNMLGHPNQGMYYFTHVMIRERLNIALIAISSAEIVLQSTVKHCRQRVVYGKTLLENEHISYKLAEFRSEVLIGRNYIDSLIKKLINGDIEVEETSVAKWWCTELLQKVSGGCSQFFGGEGYLVENLVSRIFVNSRGLSILGGSNEVMKSVIARNLRMML